MGPLSIGLYLLDTINSNPYETYLISNIILCNQCLSRVSPVGIKLISENGTVKGITIGPSGTPFHCLGYISRKVNLTPIPNCRSSRASKLLELVHSDVRGPFEVPSFGGSFYIK